MEFGEGAVARCDVILDKIQKERARERVTVNFCLAYQCGAGGADRNDDKLHVYVTRRREFLDTATG